ncbi:FAD-binding oxidoreductase [Ornithinibacillus scapharcae]|uniref:FAD-binding oxidoreductase n=1 Tax=Ornithinibacillus scapharcae TaxID=1147159 RepID=UPI000225AD68|nr:FAD-dependent oxidoreductase [Ornithinibacillus scapharcae]
MGHEVEINKLGQKIEWNHPLYHFKRKVWNSHIDQYPAIIFDCKCEEDVIAAVQYAKQNGYHITVRGGGFHPAGKSVKNDAVLIDLTNMNQISIDEVSKIAVVEAGVKTYEVDEVTQEYGLAVPLGMVSNIGVAGLALGGGIGYLRGKHGLTSDNVVGVHLVTADGKLLYVNQFEHPELFWAIRGAGSNFGIVTKFELKLHQTGPNVLAVDVSYDYNDIRQVLNKADNYRKQAPDDIAFNLIITNMNQEQKVSQPAVRLIGMYDGQLNLQVEKEIIQPLLELATPTKDDTEITTYLDMQKKFDSLVREGFAIEGISLFLNQLTQDLIEMLLEELEKTMIPATIHLIELHGKINRISKFDTAFNIRDASYLLVIDAEIASHPEETKEWIHSMYEKLLPHSYNQTSYLNSSLVCEEVIRNTYQCIHKQLVVLKKEYDPDNLFCPEHKLID